MQLRNVPSFGLGNHKEQSNNEIQEQLTAQNSANPLADKTSSPQGTQESEKLSSVSDGKLSKGIDTALTGTALIYPAARPAVMALKAGKEVAEKTIDKIRELQQSNKATAASNTIRDSESAKFFSQNSVQDMADEKVEARQAIRRDYEPTPS